jgi:hypothetical protein
MSTRLVAWKKKQCSGLDINVLDLVWFSTEKARAARTRTARRRLAQLLQTLISDAYCWLDCLSLRPNQTDPVDCRVRPMDGVMAVR